jgi:hypothetical protein
MDAMGCCSSCIKCSDAKECVHKDDIPSLYKSCTYRRHLEAGRIFYGANRNTDKAAPIPPEQQAVDPVSDHQSIEPDKSIFLHCMGRVFSIYARQKNLWSIAATPEQISVIENAFDDAGIPYKPEIDDMSECVIDCPTDEDSAPANSRVVFEINGIEYHVLNYNSWLIKKAVAEKISKAFDNHFITSRVEHRGKYANANKVETFTTYQTKPIQRPLVPDEAQKITVQDAKDEIILPEEKTVPAAAKVQTSIFELYAKQLLDDLQDVSPEIQKINTIPDPYQIRPPITFDFDFPAGAAVARPGQCIVIADDKFCGAYLGELVKTRTMQMDYKFAHVRIIEMLRYPLQHAIFNKNAEIKRKPYEIGSEHSFDLASILFLFESTNTAA